MEFGRFAPRSRRGVDVRHWDVEMSVSRSAIGRDLFVGRLSKREHERVVPDNGLLRD